MVLVGVVCVGPHNEMGIDNRCCFNIPEDRKFFRSLIADHTVIVGRITFESMPKSVFKKCEQVIVLTQSDCRDKPNEGNISYQHGFPIKYIDSNYPVYVIGGNNTFKRLESMIQMFYVTRVNRPVEVADTYFTVDLKHFDTITYDKFPSGDDWKIIKYTRCNHESDIKTYPPKQKLV